MVEIITLVILADANRRWRPSRHEYGLGGFHILFEFPTCKLLDIVAQAPEDDRSLPVVVARAQIIGLKERDPKRRFDSKWRLIRSLYEHGYRAEVIRQSLSVH